MAVSELTVAENHESGTDKGDAVFSEPATPGPDASTIKLKITETHHI